MPLMPVTLTTPGLEHPLSLRCTALLDTGSDCTLVPLPLLMQVNAQVADRFIRIPVGGQIAIAIPHEVGLVFDRYNHPVFRVFGCPTEDIGDILLLGRDLLNQYRIEFDGLDGTFTVF